MRPTCVDCAIKHLAEASILLQESRHGYPDHIYYSRGHMAEAEAELAQLYPVHADLVRVSRKTLEQDPDFSPDFMGLMKQIDEECEVCALSGNPRSVTGVTPFAWTRCETLHPRVREKIISCVGQVKASGADVNPFAVCRAAIACPGG